MYRRRGPTDEAPACSNCQKKNTRQGKLGHCAYNGPALATATSTDTAQVQVAHQPTGPSNQTQSRDMLVSADIPDAPLPLDRNPTIPRPNSTSAPAPILPPLASVSGTFANDINQAVTTRLGPPSAERPSLIPTSDVPLFGLLGRPNATNTAQNAHNVLPPRKHADYLLDIYWRYLFPLEPLVDKTTFLQSYQALFAGTLPDDAERLFLSTLNTIFAISTQIQESLAPDLREEASKTYFHRAWALLQPGNIMWEPASLDLVQCLLLVSRYLQLTNHTHQTWMAVGCAVRVAQSLGLGAQGTVACTGPTDDAMQLRKQLWQGCVFMDRTVSWAFGRVSTVPWAEVTTNINPEHEGGRQGSAHYFTKTLELYEIANSALLPPKPMSNPLAERLGRPHPDHLQTSDGIATAIDMGDCIEAWERCLPEDLRLDYCEEDTENRANEALYRQKILLRLR